MGTLTSTETPRLVQYTVTTSSSGPFDIPFTFADNDEIKVYIDGVEITEFLVTKASEFTTQGNTITLETAVSNKTVTIESAADSKRTSTDGLTTASINTEIDNIYANLQEIDLKLSRAITLPVQDPLNVGMTLLSKTDRAGGFLSFDSSGNVAINSVANLNFLNLESLSIDNLKMDGNTFSSTAGNVTVDSAGDITLDHAINSSIYFAKAGTPFAEIIGTSATSELRLYGNTTGTYIGLTAEHFTNSSTIARLKTDNAPLYLDTDVSGTIYLQTTISSANDLIKLDTSTADTLKISTSTSSGAAGDEVFILSNTGLVIDGTVTATAFSGSASQITVTDPDPDTDANHYILGVSSTGTGNKSVVLDGGVYFNPFLNRLYSHSIFISGSPTSNGFVGFEGATENSFETFLFAEDPTADRAIYLPNASGTLALNTVATTSANGLMSSSDKSKLDGIESSADVTDSTNVAAAGALMDSEVTNLAQVKAFDSSDYATAAQGTLATNALPKAGGTLTGSLSGTSATFSGDISAANATLTGYLRGPASFTIDPANHGDDTGTVVIAGNLQIDGTTTTINSTTVDVDDLNITVAKGAANAAAADGAGFTIDGANIEFKYNNTGAFMSLNSKLEVSDTITCSSGFVGNASSASEVYVTDPNPDTDANHYILGVASTSSGNKSLVLDGGVYFNPSLNRLYSNSIFISGAPTGSGFVGFEGATANSFETFLFATDPTADRAIYLPDLGGTLTVTGASQNVSFGTLTANGGISVDNITIDGTEINLSSGDLTLHANDVAGDIILDADGGDITLKDDGIAFGKFSKSSDNFIIESQVQDGRMKLQGNDGGIPVVALSFDMSNAGDAAFNRNVGAGITPIERLHSAGAVISTGSNATSATSGAERAVIDLTSNAARIGHFRGSTSAGSGSLELYTDSTKRLTIDSSGNVDVTGTVTLDNTLNISGGSTTGFLQASGTSLQLGASTASNFLLYTNNAEAIRIDASQNIGIGTGTSTIGDKLVVQGASSATASIVIQDPTADDYGTHLSYDDANSKAIFGGLTNGTKNPALRVARDAASGIDIDSSGNVGINCTPDGNSKLHLKGTQEIQATNSTNGWQLYTYTDNTFRINYNGAGADEITLDSSGNVMINTTTEGVAGAQQFTVASTDSGNTGITVRSGTNSAGALFFSNATSGSGEYAGGFEYNHQNDYLRVLAGSAERMRISSSGNVDVTGTVTADGLNVEIEDNNSGPVTIQQGGNSYLKINTTNSSETVELGNSTTKPTILLGSGNVGIGTTNPIGDLSIVDSSTGSGIEIQPEVDTDTNRITNFDRVESAYKKFRLNASEQQFYIGASEAMRIDSNLNLILKSTSDVGNRIQINGADETSEILELGIVSGGAQLTASHASGGSNTADMIFRTRGGGSTSEAMRIDSDKRVGIGGISPNSYWSNADDLVVKSDGNTGISVVSATTSVGYLIFADGTGGGDNTRGGVGYDHSTNEMLFRVNNDTEMKLTNSKLDLQGNNLEGVTNIKISDVIYHEGDLDTYMYFETDTVSFAVGSTTRLHMNNSGVRVGSTNNGYFRGISGQFGSIEIDGNANGGWEGYSIGGRAVFMHDNSVTTGLYDDENNNWLFEGIFGGETRMYYNGTQKIAATSAGCTVAGAVTATSDIRYKKNIEKIDSALDKVKSLRGVTFEWNDDKLPVGCRSTGVIAQEVEAVLPEAVIDNPAGYKSVAYGNMVGLLIEAIKEQQEQIDELKKELGKWQ